MNFVVIIPARYQSSRLPGKPLLDISGLPMIVRTYKQVEKAVDKDLIYVATDDSRIQVECEKYNIKTVLTSASCLTGTDRVAECLEYFDADTFINVQGDEPIFDPQNLKLLIQSASRTPGVIINGYARIQDPQDFNSRSIPKVTFREDGRLLYMSRAPIPSNKVGTFEDAFRQICAYAFPRDSLEAFRSRRTKTAFESIEDIEILRFLELGYEVKMIEMSANSIAIDTAADLKRLQTFLQES